MRRNFRNGRVFGGGEHFPGGPDFEVKTIWKEIIGIATLFGEIKILREVKLRKYQKGLKNFSLVSVFVVWRILSVDLRNKYFL